MGRLIVLILILIVFIIGIVASSYGLENIKTISYVINPDNKIVSSDVNIDRKLLDDAKNRPNDEQIVILTFDSKPSNMKKFIKNLGGEIVYDYSIIDSVAIKIKNKNIEKLKNLGSVKKIEAEVETQIFLSESAPLIETPYVWENLGYNGNGVTVCILDSGINYTHPNLKDAYLGGHDFVNNDDDPYDDNGHGTHVAGIIASNDSVYNGIAYAANIYMVKTQNSGGGGTSTTFLAGVDWCVNHGADVISASLGTTFPYIYDSDCESYALDSGMAQAAANTVKKGIVFVAASGNDGRTTGIASPACGTGVISVGSVGDGSGGHTSDVISSFTNRASNLDVLAPGALITSTVNPLSSLCSRANEFFGNCGGTSQATPHVAGLAALMLQKNPKLLVSGLNNLIKQAGKSIYDSASGLTFPRINVTGAVKNTPGYLEAYKISNNKEVPQNNTFNFSVGVRCINGDCGDIDGLLKGYKPSSGELAYDDGSESSAYSFQVEDAGFAVKFTPLNYPYALSKVRFKIADTYAFMLHIWEDNSGMPGNDLITPFQFTPSSSGWIEIDLSHHNININSGSFFVGWTELSPLATSLWMDETYDAGRSFANDGTGWQDVSIFGVPGNWMIRAEDGGNFSISTITGDKPFSTTNLQPQSCGNMQENDECELTWNLNATGNFGDYFLFATFNSSLPISEESSDLVNVTIIAQLPQLLSITVDTNDLTFGTAVLNENIYPQENPVHISVESNMDYVVTTEAQSAQFTGPGILSSSNLQWNQLLSGSYTSYSSSPAEIGSGSSNKDFTLYHKLSVLDTTLAGDYTLNIIFKAVAA